MKIDIVSVFPEYFDVLNLSLFGKAQEKVSSPSPRTTCATGRMTCIIPLTIRLGGGAGMVMKPEVWAECLDDLLGLAPRSHRAGRGIFRRARR